jgi:excinuclease ABC subunit A
VVGADAYSLAQGYGFSLDTPFKDLPPAIVDLLFYGTKGGEVPGGDPARREDGERWEGREMSFGGIINFIERNYRRYRKEGRFNTGWTSGSRR